MERFAVNIKRSRTKINPETVNEYFDSLESGIPPDFVFSYDETNLGDDPGRKKCLMKQGTKYLERILNNSKSWTSLMFCDTATEQILPVYVVYKALNVYQGWMERGLPNARYSSSKSGLTMTPLRIGSSKFFFQLPKPKSSHIKSAMICFILFRRCPAVMQNVAHLKSANSFGHKVLSLFHLLMKKSEIKNCTKKIYG